jgi:putative ABC transport system permease protein
MNNDLAVIPLENLALAFIPVAIVLFIMFRWSLGAGKGAIAIARMVLQLLFIGYLLNWVFSVDSSLIVIGLLCFMLLVASWIAMRPLENWHLENFGWALLAIFIAGSSILALITTLVLKVEPWYAPRQVIPLAGMIFASAMNTVSIAAERFAAEQARGENIGTARHQAYQAGLIPLLNSLLAVGLVSLPGMMTGQILSGVSPLLAVRYQIMVMCMLTGASGIAAAIYLALASRQNP